MAAALAVAAGPLRAEENLLAAAAFDDVPAGQAPGKPWRAGPSGSGLGVMRQDVPDFPGVAWMRFIDRRKDQNTNLRLALPPVRKGVLSFRLIAVEVGGTFGVYLGRGEASAVEDRLVALKVNPSGRITLSSGAVREETAMNLSPSFAYHLYLRFEQFDESIDIEFGEIREGQDHVLRRLSSPEKFGLSMLRLTTDKANDASDFYLGDLRLVRE